MSELVRSPEDRFSRVAAHLTLYFPGVSAPSFTGSEPLRNTPVPDKVNYSNF